MSEGPAEILRRAATLLRKRAEAATPGLWERPLDIRTKDIIIAALPEDEAPRRWQDGTIPADAASWSGPTGRYAGQRERCVIASVPANNITGFDRKRSGRDLDYIASMHPIVGLAVAKLLATAADLAADALHVGMPECVHDEPCRCERSPSWGCDRCGDWLGGGCRCWDEPLAIACSYLGCSPAAIAATAEGRVA